MGRHRTVDRDALLDAAETVVRRDGAARLTLEAVAAQAGISKASVLYDCGSKSGLVAAIVERRLDHDSARIRSLQSALGDAPNACVRAHIAFAAEEIDPDDREVTMSICGALAFDAALAAPIRAEFDRLITEIRGGSPNPGGAMLAFLALEGLQALERFDIYQFSPQDRRTLLSEIERLTDQDPADWTSPHAAPSRLEAGPQDAPAAAPDAAPDSARARRRLGDV